MVLGLVFLLQTASAAPARPSFDAASFDPLVLDGMRQGAYPGAALVVGRRDTVLFAKGYGHLTWSATSRAVDPESTMYDLASLTKVIATTPALMLLVERGRVRLDAPVATYLPELRGTPTARVTARQLLALPRDAGILGMDPDELDVALAVRMSMSIPIFFEPVRVKDAAGKDHVIVDGGMLSNFPVWLFDCEDEEVPDWPTFGMLLVEPDPKTPIGERIPPPEPAPRGVRGLVALLSGMVHTMMEAHDRLYLEKAQYARTISIPTLGVHTTEFDITPARTQALYESGRSAAEKWKKSFPKRRR